MDQMIDGVILTPLRVIPSDLGNVYHGMRKFEPTFSGFGEAYFSEVRENAVKGWKKHTEMVLNIIVPIGTIEFVLYDDREKSKTYKQLNKFELSLKNYQRLTVPPGVYMAFKGKSDRTNMLLNIASIPHNPDEAVNLPLDNDLIPHDWS